MESRLGPLRFPSDISMVRLLAASVPVVCGLAGSLWILRRRARIGREQARDAELKRIAAIIQRLGTYCGAGADQGAGEEVNDFTVVANGEECQGCGSLIYGKAFHLPRLPGYHCSVECVKAHLASLDIPIPHTNP